MSCRVLNNRLVHYFDKEGALHEGQAGFRVNRSCMDNVYNLNEIVEGRLKEDTLFFRFTESVDTVRRDGFMTYRCAVFLEGEKSAVFRLEQGVAQGCSLSPILVKCSALWASLSEPHRGTHSGCCHIIYATPTGYRIFLNVSTRFFFTVTSRHFTGHYVHVHAGEVQSSSRSSWSCSLTSLIETRR